MPSKSRSKNKDNARRAKKKTSILVTEGVEYVDWKDVNLLRRFMSDGQNRVGGSFRLFERPQMRR